MQAQSKIISLSSETEVSPKAKRRRFVAAYKQRILEEADACSQKGELGALLRREGLYSSHLAAWRAARAQDGVGGLGPKKRGPKQRPPVGPEAKRVLELERQLRRANVRADRAEALVEFQKKVADLLGLPMLEADDDEKSS